MRRTAKIVMASDFLVFTRWSRSSISSGNREKSLCHELLEGREYATQQGDLIRNNLRRSQPPCALITVRHQGELAP